ncbi:MAG: Na+/H+ antiporter subunit E [Gammaproteobacteria bacterium]|nr:Na+/H+ antiporter subunit E [Gammaproteobacteria bacterium]
MKHAVSLTLTLFTLWLLLSGHFNTLLIALGVASSLVTVVLALRMEVIDHESHPLHLSRQLPRFWVFLSREIVLANLDVVRRILTPGKSFSPQLRRLPLPQRTELGQVIYANAITLTPGTVTVQLNTDSIRIHALSREAAEDLQTGRMAKAIPDNLEDKTS